MKTCTKCGETKPLDGFHKRKSSKDGKQPKCKACIKAYQQSNKKAMAERARKYYQENKEKRTEYGRSYYKDKKSDILKYKKRHNKENREAIRVRKRVWWKGWYQENKEKRLHITRLYQLKKAKASPKWLTSIQLAHIKRTYRLRQVISEATGLEYHVDHIVPLNGDNVCGLHVPWNLQVLPWDLNLSKGNTYNE